MVQTYSPAAADHARRVIDENDYRSARPQYRHAVSWPAIFAGAAGAAALSLILLILGTGLGLSSVSPWTRQGISATAFGASTILWITFTQLAASGLGGYLAGRLRSRWADTQPDEVYFRDTAHGFLAWAVASLATAALLTSVIASIVGGGVQAGATAAAGGGAAASRVAAQVADKAGDDGKDDMAYFIHALFRGSATAPTTGSTGSTGQGATTPPAPSSTSPSPSTSSDPATVPVPTPAVSPTPLPAPAPSPEASAAEATGIFLNALRNGALPADDAAYLGQQVAARTGLSVPDAQKRVTEAFARVQIQAREADATAREAADKARKASAKGALWLFVSLLIGAFVASLAATFGGRQRDAA
ncbi:hypothetical protein [Hydrogenophaga sp. 2FB]|uniref:hypothetical protein n=1 Tax=Hydrogenophaga sp. 2FB TaxID=2502187 RepID=UPI0010F46EBF|nr:hypothetical protein [Hydrogenophaga sp. 2FB]